MAFLSLLPAIGAALVWAARRDLPPGDRRHLAGHRADRLRRPRHRPGRQPAASDPGRQGHQDARLRRADLDARRHGGVRPQRLRHRAGDRGDVHRRLGYRRGEDGAVGRTLTEAACTALSRHARIEPAHPIPPRHRRLDRPLPQRAAADACAGVSRRCGATSGRHGADARGGAAADGWTAEATVGRRDAGVAVRAAHRRVGAAVAGGGHQHRAGAGDRQRAGAPCRARHRPGRRSERCPRRGRAARQPGRRRHQVGRPAAARTPARDRGRTGGRADRQAAPLALPGPARRAHHVDPGARVLDRAEQLWPGNARRLQALRAGAPRAAERRIGVALGAGHRRRPARCSRCVRPLLRRLRTSPPRAAAPGGCAARCSRSASRCCRRGHAAGAAEPAPGNGRWRAVAAGGRHAAARHA